MTPKRSPLFLLCGLIASLAVFAALTSVRAQMPAEAAANIQSDVLYFSYELENWVDPSQRPCDNFYSYVCGKSLNSSNGQGEQALRQQQQKFDEFITNDGNVDQLLDSELKLKYFYDSCKNARSEEDLKSSLMYRTSGGWPAIDDTAAMIRRRRNMTWLHVLGAFHEVGVHRIFRHQVEIKSNVRVVLIEPDESVRYTLRKLEQLAIEVLEDYAVEAPRTRLIALETLAFERTRREIVKDSANNGQREGTYKDFKTTLFTQLDWDGYFKRILGKPLKDSDIIVVGQYMKMERLFGMMRNTTMTRLLNWLWIDYLSDKSSKDCQSLVQHFFKPVYENIIQRSALNRMEMAQMYVALGHAYDHLLPVTPWIDEMSQQNSKQYLGRIMHLTMNGDVKLDSDYADVSLTKRNFYRNLEKVQRFLDKKLSFPQSPQGASAALLRMDRAAENFMHIFSLVNVLLKDHNLTSPLNYVLIGERFAEHMIDAGSYSDTPGAWRSMDSDREYANFKQCMAKQHTDGNSSPAPYNLNDLVLRILAKNQTLHAWRQWQEKHEEVVKQLDRLLRAGHLGLTLQKLYFVGSLITNCGQYGPREEQEKFVNDFLRNSREFSEAFACKVGDRLYVANICKV